MDSLHKLTTLFRRFPGIGPRQAKRFVYFLLGSGAVFRRELSERIESLPQDIAECRSCHRFFEKRASPLCPLCADPNRSERELMVIARDTDLEAIEKSGSFQGRYFVLGGTIPLLEKESHEKLRTAELCSLVEKKVAAGTLVELILALSANPDGDYTAKELRRRLAPLITKGLRVTTLGRGLSTGSELEYADPETIKSAFKNRSS